MSNNLNNLIDEVEKTAPEKATVQKDIISTYKTAKNGRFVLGEPSGTFDEKPRCAKQLGRNSHRNDWAADIALMGEMMVFGASLRGAMHYGLSTIRQDSFAIGSESNTGNGRWIIAVIADGVSSASQSHTFADFMARQAVIVIGEELNLNASAKLQDFDWKKIAERLVGISDDFCRTAAKRVIPEEKATEIYKALPKDFIQKWATTLEFIVVQATGGDSFGSREYVHVTVTGDGAAYILNKKLGWRVIKRGKQHSDSAITSNAVLSLPLTPEAFLIEFGSMNKNDCLLISTDGLSDFIGDGNSPLGSFLKNKLPKCRSLISFLQIVDVSLYQADDDRTLIMIKRND